MQCPRCAHPELDRLAFDRRTSIDWCTACGGAWYEEGELERTLGLDRSVSVASEGRSLKPGVICPACGTPTAEVTWPREGNVRIDACTRCGGRWLDRGELEGMRAVLVQRGGGPFPAAGSVGGQVVRIPLGNAGKIARQLQVRWIAVGAVAMLVAYAFILGGLRFLSLFDAMSSQDAGPTSSIAAMAGLLAFPLGGVLIGRGSSGFTIWEAAVAAVPAAIAMATVSKGTLGTGQAAAMAVAGFVLALLGAIVGERISQT